MEDSPVERDFMFTQSMHMLVLLRLKQGTIWIPATRPNRSPIGGCGKYLGSKYDASKVGSANARLKAIRGRFSGLHACWG
jgi:hypothetical protein